MGIGSLSDYLVLFLARRNKGYKEPEMRLWTYTICLPLASNTRPGGRESSSYRDPMLARDP